MIASVFVSNDVWTFWDVFFLMLIWIPLLMVWFFCMFDIFGRRDLSGGGKALWLLAVVFLPWLGTILYLIFRPWNQDAYGGAYTESTPSASQPVGSGTGSGGQVPTG